MDSPERWPAGLRGRCRRDGTPWAVPAVTRSGAAGLGESSGRGNVRFRRQRFGAAHEDRSARHSTWSAGPADWSALFTSSEIAAWSRHVENDYLALRPALSGVEDFVLRSG